jgi:hypothetical protein
MILELAGRSQSTDRQACRIEQSKLNKNRRLVPIDSLAADFVSLKLHDDRDRHLKIIRMTSQLLEPGSKE